MELGVAELILQKDLTKEALLKSVQKMLGESFQERAKELQQEVKQWNGLEIAARIIKETANVSV